MARRQRLGIQPADHVIQSLVGEGCLRGPPEKDGLASVGIAPGIHGASPYCTGLLVLRLIRGAHEQ